MGAHKAHQCSKVHCGSLVYIRAHQGSLNYIGAPRLKLYQSTYYQHPQMFWRLKGLKRVHYDFVQYKAL